MKVYEKFYISLIRKLEKRKCRGTVRVKRLNVFFHYRVFAKLEKGHLLEIGTFETL